MRVDVDDTANHGIDLAGLGWGGLSAALATGGSLAVVPRLEPVMLTPVQGSYPGDPWQHGYQFAEALSRPEVPAPVDLYTPIA